MKIQEDCQDCNWLHFYDIFNLIPLVSFLRIVLNRFEIEKLNDMSHMIWLISYDGYSDVAFDSATKELNNS